MALLTQGPCHVVSGLVHRDAVVLPAEQRLRYLCYTGSPTEL